MTPIPFQISIPDTDLADLHQRLAHTRWPEEAGADSWQEGPPVSYLKNLSDHWQGLDWRKQEGKLNAFPQFTACIDGQTLHFFHLRSKHPQALPLLLLHGWPSCGVEFLSLVSPLTDPVALGGQASDAFHLVIPTMPGFGLSPAPKERGWTSRRIGQAYAQLMALLGYERYGVQGTDMGADVAAKVDAAVPRRVVGIHINMDPSTIVAVAAFTGMDLSANQQLSAEGRERVEAMIRSLPERNGYLEIQKTRPKTIGYALHDSPIAQLAWMIEKFQEWSNPDKPLPEDASTLETLLSMISLYWFSGAGATSARMISETMRASEWSPPSSTPNGIAVFGADGLSRALLDPGHRLGHFSEFSQGGHFPALEEARLLAQDLRSFFARLR